MTYLSSNQLKQYEDQGYISPIEVLSSSEALEARKEIELIEKYKMNELNSSEKRELQQIILKKDKMSSEEEALIKSLSSG